MPTVSTPTAPFLEAALCNLRDAEEVLARHPELTSADFWSALVSGHIARVEQELAESPAAVTLKGGPQDWEPLLYVCFSRFASAKSSRAGELAATARLLLAHGANPNAFYIDKHWPEWPLPCLYGASGVNNNVELTGVLLDAGAKPDDNESLYHSTEHDDLAAFRVLLARGASARATNVLHHMLDKDELEGVRLLLAAGADPNHAHPRGGTSLHWAVWRGRSAAIVEALLDAGAAIDARRERDGRTAYAIAVLSGQTATAHLLARHGADTTLSEVDRMVGDLMAGGPAPAQPLPEEYALMVPDLASSHSTAAVRALLAAGVPVNTMGSDGCTALHWACWKGYADLVELLLARGASLTIEDTTYHATPPGWANHGRHNSNERGDFDLTERLLRDAGAKMES